MTSIAIPRPFPRDNSKQQFTLPSRKWFDRELWYPNLLKALKKNSDFASEDCKQIGLLPPIDLIRKKLGPQIINSASRVFDACVSKNELSKLRGFAKKGEADEYVSSKPILDRKLQELL